MRIDFQLGYTSLTQPTQLIFMQTNREDVGDRMLELKIPIPRNRAIADKLAEPFCAYFKELEEARRHFAKKLERSQSEHHIYL